MKLELKSYDQTPKDPRNGEFGANHELVTASVIYISCVTCVLVLRRALNILKISVLLHTRICYLSCTSA